MTVMEEMPMRLRLGLLRLVLLAVDGRGVALDVEGFAALGAG